jgi:hypothetical protein
MNDKPGDLAGLFAALERRSYRTYSSRLQASQRLAARNRAWNASLIATSTAATIASVALLTDSTIYGKSGPTLLVCVSILTLVASLVASGLDYSGRSRDMFLSYRRLQRLSAEVERHANSPATQTHDVLENLHQRYDALLDESENHTEADFYRAFPDEDKKTRSLWRETSLSLMPYLSLAAPVGLLIPLVIWIAKGG